jgi:phosphoribosylformimino-5-aminoimidazole carboxamide ribotide isomerase
MCPVIAAPAVDVKEGRCVQLVGGRPDAVAVSLPSPVAAAVRWYAAGFRTLHVVDLDAALGSGDNLAAILEVLAATDAETQVGGGVRDDARAQALLDGGADRIVVGTRALDDAAWLRALAGSYPGRVMVALDTRDGRILRRGWTEESALELSTYLPSLEPLPLAGILSTNVAREGRLAGIDREACREVIEASPHPVWASGGVTTVAELEYLERIGAAGAVLGMALYTDTLNAADVAARWGRVGTRAVPQ